MGLKIPILLYHSIDAGVAPAFETWAVAPKRFTEHMQYIVENGYTLLTVSQLVDRLQKHPIALPDKPIVVTFDDGFLDFYENAMPILTRYNVPTTLYITTGYIGSTSRWLWREGEGERPMMTWSQVREIDANRIECGGHTITHPQLDIISRQQAQTEIIASKHALEDCLGKNVLSFAYPHGYFDTTVRRFVQEAGYGSACGVKHAMSTVDDDIFALARIIVTSSTSVEQLAHLIEGNDLPIAPTYERFRTKIWRLVRWTKQKIDK